MAKGTGDPCPLKKGIERGRARNELGDLLATWLTDNAEAIGVQYLIWDRTSWSVNKRGGTKLYTGSHPHNEHIHVEITEEAGRKETPFFSNPESYLPAWRVAAPWPEHDPDLNLDDDPDVPESIMENLMAEDYDDAPSSGSVSAFTASNARLETKMTEDPWTPDPYEVVNVREGANAYWVTLIFAPSCS